MKKVLYGTSALLVAGLFASAAEAAAPLALNINGNLNAWMGYTDVDVKGVKGTYNKFDVATDGQIVFNASTKLDNGITIGGVAELKIADGSDWDDVYVYGEGQYGKVILGATENSAVLLHHDAPNASPLSTDDIMDWMGAGFLPVYLDSTAPDFDGNAQKITYITPKFAGFSAGVSYIPGAEVKVPFTSNNFGAYDKSVGNNRDFYNAWSLAGAYDAKVGSVNLGADLGVASYNAVGQDAVVTYNAGISAEIQGFTASFSYIYADLNAEDGDVKDAHAWEFGLGYKADKFATSVSWFETKNGKTKGTAGILPNFEKAKVDVLKVAGDYKLSAGVDAFAEFAYVDTDKITNDDPSAWTIITGLGLTF